MPSATSYSLGIATCNTVVQSLLGYSSTIDLPHRAQPNTAALAFAFTLAMPYTGCMWQKLQVTAARTFLALLS